MTQQFTIVLAYPRTGSSMCMQTLKNLGVFVFGDAERPDLDVDGNPKGYFEDLRVLGAGLTEEVVREYQSQAATHLAFKLSYKPLLRHTKKSTPETQINLIKQLDPRFIIPVRPPVESIISILRWAELASPTERFIRVTSRLKKYKEEVEQILDILQQGNWLTPDRSLILNYHSAIESPADYVNAISNFTNCKPCETQIEAAIANITPDLFRYRMNELACDVLDWDQKIGATAAYEKLLKPLTK